MIGKYESMVMDSTVDSKLYIAVAREGQNPRCYICNNILKPFEFTVTKKYKFVCDECIKSAKSL